jgi:peptide/nickel transport system substrate-binding protein
MPVSIRTLHRGRRGAALLVGTAAVVLALAGCSGDPSDPSDEKPTLTIALASAPTSLDPSKGSGGANATYQLAAYSTLLHVGEVGGEPEPALAESWQWLDDSNQQLEITLREGLTFSDGAALDAEAVKGSIEHFAEGGSVFSFMAAPIESIETPDERTVVFSLNAPTPTFPVDLAEGPGMGSIISPDALASDPEALGTSTAGAGPYMLSKDGTVEGSEYRYVPNPEYFDPESVAYSSVTIKVIADPNTALSTLQSGQLDIAYGSPDSYERATSGGVEAFVRNTNVNGLWIQDWDGVVVPALGDQRVRQAINLALDRESIADAVTLGLGGPAVQTPVEGSLGYDSALDETYPFDLDQAQALMDEAGFSDGFDMPIIVPTFNTTSNALSQAIADQLSKIGIRVQITGSNTFPEYAQAQESGTFVGTVIGLDMAQGIPAAMSNIFAPQALVNPRKTELPDVVAGVAAASALPGEAADTAWQEVNALLVDGAYAAPVLTEPLVTYYTEAVAPLELAGPLNPVYIAPRS